MPLDNVIPVPTVLPEQNVDVEQVTVGAVTANRQRVILVPGIAPHGCADYHVVAANGTNAASVKASPGQLYGWKIYNNAGYPIFVKLHNTAAVPTPGAGVVMTLPMQAGVSDTDFIVLGVAFSVGIGITIVKGIADGDATPVVAEDCVVDLLYA